MEKQGSLGLKVEETPLGKNLSTKIHSSWYDNENIYSFINNKKMLRIAQRVKYDEMNKRVVYPAKEDRFRALRLPMSRVKVVIIGQDPYHNDNADGLAFSCKRTKSPSLLAIQQCIWQEVYDKDEKKLIDNYMQYYESTDFPKADPIGVQPKELQRWAKQGILLLNSALTVVKGKPNSHADTGWHEFVGMIIKELSKEKKELYFLLWGRKAEHFIKYIDKKNEHKVLTAEHPMAAVYDDREWYCNHFEQVLETHPDIIW